MFNRTSVAAALLITSATVALAEPPRKVVKRGTLSVLQTDDFERGSTSRVHTLIDDETGEPFTLRFPASPDARLRTGSRVVVRGLAIDREIQIGTGSDSFEVVEAADAPAMEARRAVVIVVDFDDAAVSCSNDAIAGLMFTGSSSVDGLFQAASFGLVSVPGDTDGNGAPDVVRVSIPNSVTEACDAYGWASAAEAAAQDAGVNFSLYQHRVIVLPSNVTCSWAGLGNVGCGAYCRAWVKTCNLQDVYAHEIGHNLDMAHASTDTNNDGTVDCEYCDQSDIMGYGGVGWRLFSAPHEAQKSWIPASKIQEISVAGGGTFVLSPLQADPATTAYPQILKIRKSDSSDWYYLSYRQREGYDASLGSGYVDRTNVHRYAGSGYNNTKFILALSDDQVFSDAANGITVRQISHDAMSATLQISTTCTLAAPTVTMSPARLSGRPGQQLTFTMTVINRDAAACGSSTFNLTGSGPAGFVASVTPATVTLAPNAQASLTLRATSPLDALDGDNPIVATAQALAGPGSAQTIYAVDGTAPAPVTGVTATLGRKGIVEVRWPASTDPAGVPAYRVIRNGIQIASVGTLNYQDRYATTAGTYDYAILAVDGVGNTSAVGNVARVTVGTSGGGGGGKGGGGGGGGKPTR